MEKGDICLESLKIQGLSLEEYLAQETQTRTVRFWGSDHEVTPVLVSEVHGDGLQIVYLEPLFTRPNYYILRIDSSVDLYDDESLPEVDKQNYGSVQELLLQMVEEEYDCLDRYDEGKDGLYFDPYDDEIEPFEYEFPMLDWGGGSWGQMANFKTGGK